MSRLRRAVYVVTDSTKCLSLGIVVFVVADEHVPVHMIFVR